MKSPALVFTKGFLFTIVLSLVFGLGAIMIASSATAQMKASQWDGYLADSLCAKRGTALDGADMVRHPEKHTVECLKEPPCVASGYGILTKSKDGTYTFHKFDKQGDKLALELIKKTKKKDSISVKVTGQVKDGIINVAGIEEK